MGVVRIELGNESCYVVPFKAWHSCNPLFGTRSTTMLSVLGSLSSTTWLCQWKSTIKTSIVGSLEEIWKSMIEFVIHL
jgi:hypothetical protein